MKCPATGEYVMYMHADDMRYRDPYTAYATSDKITGPYTVHGPLMYAGKPLKHWDMGVFQDTDGSGYVLIHHGPIYRLTDDYRAVAEKVAHVEGCGESPAVFKKDGCYYHLSSNLTSWERNDNYYYTAPSMRGPWKRHGTFLPRGVVDVELADDLCLPPGRRRRHHTYVYGRPLVVSSSGHRRPRMCGSP